MNTIEAFERWLEAEGYQPSTVVEYGTALATLARAAQGGHTPTVSPSRYAAGKAFLRYPASEHAVELHTFVQAYVARAHAVLRAPTGRVAARRAAQARRKREATSIGPEAFTALAALAWEEPGNEGAALSLIYATGLRVGDVLPITRRALQLGKQHGIVRLVVKGGDTRQLPWSGAPEEWGRLHDAFLGEPADIVTIADLIMGKPGASTLTAGGGAYMRLNRLLKAHAVRAGVDERMHLHRLRRTVAVRALTQTQDTAAVQQMLGHRNIQTTARYIDEARPQALAGIQQSINPRRKA